MSALADITTYFVVVQLPNTRGSFYFRFYLVYSLQMTSHILFAVFAKATWCNISGSLNEQNPSSTRVSTSRVAENQWSSITDSNCHQMLGGHLCYHYTNTANINNLLISVDMHNTLRSFTLLIAYLPLLTLQIVYVWSARWDSNPHGCPPDPKSGAYANFATYGYMVPATGLEPVRYCYQGILSPWCLPIPPRRDKKERRRLFGSGRLRGHLSYDFLLITYILYHIFFIKSNFLTGVGDVY